MEYVTLEQAKDHLNLIDFDDDDVYIEDLIDVSEAAVLNEIRAWSTGTGTVTTDGSITLTGTSTSFTDYQAGDFIKLYGETQRTIATIVSDTSLTVSVAFSTSSSGLSYSVMNSGLVDGVLPKPLYQAILLMVGQLYAQREPVTVGVTAVKCPFTLEYLIAPYKSWVLK